MVRPGRKAEAKGAPRSVQRGWGVQTTIGGTKIRPAAPLLRAIASGWRRCWRETRRCRDAQPGSDFEGVGLRRAGAKPAQGLRRT
jgi:hypothetical protein